MKNSVTLILLSISLSISGQFFLKKGMNEVGRIGTGDSRYYLSMLYKTFLNYKIIAGLLLFSISAIVWLVVLSRVEISFAYPFLSLSYVVVMIIAWLFFNETLNAYRWTGVLFLVIGFIFISRS